MDRVVLWFALGFQLYSSNIETLSMNAGHRVSLQGEKSPNILANQRSEIFPLVIGGGALAFIITRTLIVQVFLSHQCSEAVVSEAHTAGSAFQTDLLAVCPEKAHVLVMKDCVEDHDHRLGTGPDPVSGRVPQGVCSTGEQSQMFERSDMIGGVPAALQGNMLHLGMSVKTMQCKSVE